MFVYAIFHGTSTSVLERKRGVWGDLSQERAISRVGNHINHLWYV
jgi:hypothetical protein